MFYNNFEKLEFCHNIKVHIKDLITLTILKLIKIEGSSSNFKIDSINLPKKIKQAF